METYWRFSITDQNLPNSFSSESYELYLKLVKELNSNILVLTYFYKVTIIYDQNSAIMRCFGLSEVTAMYPKSLIANLHSGGLKVLLPQLKYEYQEQTVEVEVIGADKGFATSTKVRISRTNGRS